MAPLTLSSYPIGAALGLGQTLLPGTPGRLPALTSQSQLQLLAKKPLDEYLTNTLPLVIDYFENVQRKITKMNLKGFPQRIYNNPPFLVAVPLPPPGMGQNISVTLEVKVNMPPHTAEQGKGLAQSATGLSNIQDAVLLMDFVVLMSTTLMEFTQAQLRKITKITEETVGSLTKLKEVLKSFTSQVEDIVMHYSGCPLTKHLPEFEEIQLSNKTIQDIIRHLNIDYMRKIIPPTTYATQELILCSIVGINAKIADKLYKLPEEKRHHQSDIYWLKHFISQELCESEENLNGGTSCDGNEEVDDIATKLMLMGFTESRSEKIALWICNSPQGHPQSLEYWAFLYLDTMFDSDILLNEVPRFPFNERKVNEWSTTEVETEDRIVAEEGDIPTSINVNIFNGTKDRAKSVVKDGVAYPPGGRQTGLWYHGTCHSSACHIIRNGIQINKGKARQDFSDGDGFYISDNYGHALDWARRQHNPAVIVFKVQQQTMEKFEFLDTSQNQNVWKEIIKYNRSGREAGCKPEKGLLKDYKKVDCIVGPLSIDGTRRTAPSNPRELTNWQPTGFIKDDHTQMCIRTAGAAERFGDVRNVDSVLFFDS